MTMPADHIPLKTSLVASLCAACGEECILSREYLQRSPIVICVACANRVYEDLGAWENKSQAEVQLAFFEWIVERLRERTARGP